MERYAKLSRESSFKTVDHTSRLEIFSSDHTVHSPSTRTIVEESTRYSIERENEYETVPEVFITSLDVDRN